MDESWHDARQRRDEAKQAFLEGHRAGAGGFDPNESWKFSTARKRLGTPLGRLLPYTPPFKVAGREVQDAEGWTVWEADRVREAQMLSFILNRELGGGSLRRR